jgi:hypothetical protein
MGQNQLSEPIFLNVDTLYISVGSPIATCMPDLLGVNALLF